jgi:hypothetical protein
MMDVTADLYKTKVTIELDAEEAHILLDALNYYLGDQDFTLIPYHEKAMKQLEDKIITELP